MYEHNISGAGPFFVVGRREAGPAGARPRFRVDVMLAVFAVFLAAVTFLLIEGSLVYYLLPTAPAWLRQRKDLQVTFSSLMVNGVVAALFMLGQYLVDLGAKPAKVLDVVLVAVIVVAFAAAWRRLHALHRRLREEGIAHETKVAVAEPVTLRAA